MRPERIVMRAFGPYAGEEVLDFSPLEAEPLFLIHGPTGAGKSTLLDAICFAFYGEASGSDREAAQLRSQWAEPDRLTEVVLDFRLGDARYRIRRRPKQQRPKKRGEGFTTEEARAELWRRAPELAQEDDGELLATGVSDVTSKVRELLGLSAPQFRQVIVLPQGEFRKLLTAETADRQKILERLFDTRLYADIEEELKSRAAAAREALHQVGARLDALLHAQGLDEAPAAEAERTLAERAAAIEKEIRNVSATIERLRAKENTASALLRAREREADANRAHVAALDALQAAERIHAESQAALRRAQEGEERLAELARRLPILENVLKDSRLLTEYTTEKEKLEKKLRGFRNGLREAEQERESLTGEMEQAREMLNALRRRAVTAELYRQERRQWRQALKQREELRKLQADRDRQRATANTHEAALQRARARVERAAEHLRALHGRLQQAHAVLLARDLKPGMPCPVCGSPHHPAPASAADDARAPTEEELAKAEAALEQAQRAERQARTERDEAQGALSELQGALNALRGNLACPDLSEEALLERLRQADAALSAAREAATEAAQTEETLRKLRARAEALGARLDSLREKERAGAEALSGLNSLIEDLRKRLPEDLREAREARRKLNATRAELERLKRALERARQQHETAERGLAASRARLTDAEAAREKAAASLEKAFRKALETAALPPDADRPPTPEELQRLAEALREKLSAAQARKGELEEARRRLNDARARLRALLSEHDRAQADYDRIHGLAQLATGTGGNNKKISLQRFVLSALLDEVLAAASLRLMAMTQGRYELRRRTASDDLRKAWGLDLEVMDYHTGKARPARTLSGGESFMAALSLALGLAEVVQRRSGGVWLETLFIDEGFGALDAEALDQALDTLLALRAEGRLIGIVSHVAELRERIPAQLRVEKGARGSHIRFVNV